MRRAHDQGVVAADDLEQRRLGVDVDLEALRPKQLDAGVGDRLADEYLHGCSATGRSNASNALTLATPRSTSAPELDERELERGERGDDVEDVEPADVADPHRLALQLALAGREGDAVVLAQVLEQVVGVDAVGHADRRDDGGRVVVRREQLEPHRLDAGARGAAEAHVPLERRLEARLEEHPERDIEAAQERDRRREGGVEVVLRLLRRRPVEVERPRRHPRPRALGDRGEREPGRAHQRLLGAGEHDVDPPGLRLERDGAERRDRIDDERRVADGLPERAHVGDDAGRGVGLLAEDDVDAALAHRGTDLVGVGLLAPGVAHGLNVEAVPLADRDPALAERAVADDRDAVAGRAEVEHRGLHRARAGGAEDEHVVRRPDDVAQLVRARARRSRGSRRRGGGRSARPSRRAPPAGPASGRA